MTDKTQTGHKRCWLVRSVRLRAHAIACASSAAWRHRTSASLQPCH